MGAFKIVPVTLIALAGLPGLASALDLRLSGVITVSDERRFAVLEVAERGFLVRVGDTVADGVQVVDVGRNWVRLTKDGQEHELRLSGSHDGGDPMDVLPQDGILVVESDLKEVIGSVAADESTRVDSLASAIGAYLRLPAEVPIAVTDMSFGAFRNAAEARKTLEQMGMIRVQIGASEGQERMLYLRVPSSDGMQAPPGPD